MDQSANRRNLGAARGPNHDGRVLTAEEEEIEPKNLGQNGDQLRMGREVAKNLRVFVSLLDLA